MPDIASLHPLSTKFGVDLNLCPSVSFSSGHHSNEVNTLEMANDGSHGSYYPDHMTSLFSRYISLQENRKYAKYKNMNCSEIYDRYGKLFGDTGDSTKYALFPSKLS
ncbi:Hypothetical predicted protein [Olea europaea subsp. europaea]|uniref:Uncharacterized protein n=1 Tax=Olea europaea subsp. europaea TaxID=158383 RepID=A0A8S0TCJ7_OLEEU|nr:Hypothetical predicted protein [Olea europaea subsp. europaea]